MTTSRPRPHPEDDPRSLRGPALWLPLAVLGAVLVSAALGAAASCPVREAALLTQGTSPPSAL